MGITCSMAEKPVLKSILISKIPIKNQNDCPQYSSYSINSPRRRGSPVPIREQRPMYGWRTDEDDDN